MKRFEIFAIFVATTVFFSASAHAQGSRHDGVVQGEQGTPVAGATIVVCTQPANVTITPCTPLANLYTDTTLAMPAPNPLTADGLGNYHFYAAPGLYTVQVYGPGINTYTTPDTLLPANPSNAQFGTITATSAISALTLSLGGNLAVGGNASVTGTLTAGSLAATLAATSNAQLKGTGVVLYVDGTSAGCGGSGCSDSNDGKSWGSAMLTVDNAICLLPGGNCSASQAGSGTVYFTSGSQACAASSSAGIWIMGASDPNYSSPPTCWLKQPGSGAPSLSVIGVQSNNFGPNAPIGRALIAGGSSVDRNHPGIWLSGTNMPIYIANAAVQYPGRGIVIGECSNNVRTGTCQVSDATYDNDTANINQVAGNGPAWDITGGSFWIRLRNCGGAGTDSVNTPTSDDAAAVLVDGRTNTGVGLLFIDDFDAGSGGIKFYSGSNGGALNARKVTTEDQQGEPAVWFALGGAGDFYAHGTIDDVTVADAAGTNPGLENDTVATVAAKDIQGQISNVVGAVTLLSQYPNNLQNQVISPQRSGQTGFVGAPLSGIWNYGKRDDVQRGAGLTTVRFGNQVNGSTCGSWFATQFAGTTTQTCSGIADPFGGTNAGQVSSTSSTSEQLNFTPGSSGIDSVNLSVGEYLIGGVWTRSETANGYSGNALVAAVLAVTGTGFTTVGGCDGNSVLGDGQWTWNRCIYKVTAVGTNPASLEFGVHFASGFTVQAYGPVLNFIAPGTFSDNEAYAYENALKTYDTLCAVGATCGMEFNPIQAPSFETETANPAQSGIFRLADGDAIAWRNHANTADVSLSKNSSDQLVAPPLASPTFFSPIVDSTSGASGLTFRNTGSTVWTTNASSSTLSFNFNAHLGETTMKLAPFGGQSYAGLLDNYGMTAGFVAVTESSGTMAFDAGLGNTFEVTLNANVSSTNLVNAQAGQWLHFVICQPSSGGPFTFNWPGSMHGAMTIGTTAGKCSAQSFVFDGTSAFATSPGVANQ
jgi:hypothetical protein